MDRGGLPGLPARASHRYRLETMQEAGIAAAALEAGKVIILEKPAVLKQAKALGLTLHGF